MSQMEPRQPDLFDPAPAAPKAERCPICGMPADECRRRMGLDRKWRTQRTDVAATVEPDRGDE